MRRCVNKCGHRARVITDEKGLRRLMSGRFWTLAGWTDSKYFEEVTADGIVGVPPEGVDQFINRACGKGDSGAAAGTDQMMAVTWRPNDIGGVSAGLKDPSEDVDRRQYLKRSIDRRSSQ